METRSRKRAEASTSAASSGPTTRATKRSRLTATSVAATAVTDAKPNSISTRSRTSALSSSMDPTPDPSTASASTTRSRRGKNPSNNQNWDNNNSIKGKEKEPGIRDRELERSSGLNIDSHDADDDDNDSEDGIGGLHQNLSSPSSALQGLLRKLGAGLDDFLPSSAIGSGTASQQGGSMKKILSGLRADGEEGRQVEALTQLCELLAIGTEESLSTFPVDSFVPVLVGLVNQESNPDIMLLAARALTHLVEALPPSCAAVVHYGAIPCFVARLLTIEYVDLAEQSLQALKKISQEHPTACLRAGALMAVLSYLDFFSTGVQRVALSTAANMCKNLPSDAADFVMEAVPLLTNLLQYHDAKVLEHASICLTRIAEAFASSPQKLDDLCNHGLVTQAAALISPNSSGGGQASLSTSTYTGLIRLLSTCASGSALGAKSLLLLGISGILKDILLGSGLVSSVSVSPALSRPPEQIFEIVNLANELLPPLPQGTISLPVCSSLFVRGSCSKKSHVGSSGNEEDSDRNMHEISTREKLLIDHQPELLQQFGMDLLPVLVQIYGSSVNGAVRHKCLSVIGKLMYFSTTEMILSLMNVTNISSFLAEVLAWKDPQVLVPALQIAEILMEKLPDTFSKMFVREGVVHAVDMLIQTGSSGTSQLSSYESVNDSITGSTRSRRNRRRGGNSSSDANLVDDSKTSIPSIVSSPNSVETPTVNSGLRAAVSVCAKAFIEKHFPSDLEANGTGVTDDLVRLKNLCSRLNLGISEKKNKSKGKLKASGTGHNDISAGKEEHLIVVITDMLQELSRGHGVSTFEFIRSGVVSSLLNYFTCGCFSKERISEAKLPKLREQAIRRYKAFVSLALPSSLVEGDAVPMSILVQKLQNALSSLERFPVVLSHTSRSSSGSARLSSGLGALSQPIRLRLCRAEGEETLRDFSSNVVLIDPLASLAAVENFLWPRVRRSEPGQKPSASAGNSESGTAPASAGVSSATTSTSTAGMRRQSMRSRSSVSAGETAKKDLPQEKHSSSLKAKGKAILKATQEEGGGPQTRNASRRRAALDKDKQMQPVGGETSSEEDELDISPVEIDGTLVIGDDISDDDGDEEDDDDNDDVLIDDTLPNCLSDNVHDVRLGDSLEDSPVPVSSEGKSNPKCNSSSRGTRGRGSDFTEFRSGGSYGSRGAMSFAAAAMAGIASGNSRGVRGGRNRLGRPLFDSDDAPRLIFTAGGRQLNRHLTIYQAIQQQFVLDEGDDDRFAGTDLISSDGSRLWTDIYTIVYQRADGQAERSSPGAITSTPLAKSGKASSSNSRNDASLNHVSLLDSILQGELPCDLERSNPTYNILALLRVLDGLNKLAPLLRLQAVIDSFSEGNFHSLDELNAMGTKVLPEEFVNSKLTPKLARQIQDALALCSGSLPSWCYQLTKACPFLFPFETRRQYFYSTAFGLSRALYRLQQQQGADANGSTSEREFRVGRLQRQKVRVSRNRILDSAAKVMEMYSSQKAVLEVEYFGEVGTGLGPTLEFYTLLSHDIQKTGLGMWRSSSPVGRTSMDIDIDGKLDMEAHGVAVISSASGDRDIIHVPLGLFPRPWPPSADTSDGSQFSKVIGYFRLLGQVMAKALQDGRLLDLPLSAAFYKLLLGQELDLHDIISFDAELGRTLQELRALVHRKEYLESKGSYNLEELRFRGASIEDLCLDFSVPGYPEYILNPGDTNVDASNLGDYVSLVVDATVRSGIMRQMEAFRSGFNQVFDISTLQIFSPNELDHLLCGRRELWKAESLADHIKFDHGYTSKSPAIVNLLEIMSEFTPEQQRAFCQFVTGAPRLPPGGLAVLNPKLTIVRKHSSGMSNSASNVSGPPESADNDLPSVMTCANYLKLPPYSSKEIMYKKLLYAISEGQGSFDLS
ncbi:putative ubiquitin fusion degradation protein [Handroanthus impetiginosus]|uniref:HECT-type E3 ubiquitin transferase n=1 Tax=Handroanthus impetiginosus TaxID=429701 RepID=A0A2G9HNS2_9LAMI|nr:putative ubiquitin fusion degradation protein [Handroanthus impetiginosus]